jgi:hypothetical protein
MLINGSYFEKKVYCVFTDAVFMVVMQQNMEPLPNMADRAIIFVIYSCSPTGFVINPQHESLNNEITVPFILTAFYC